MTTQATLARPIDAARAALDRASALRDAAMARADRLDDLFERIGTAVERAETLTRRGRGIEAAWEAGKAQALLAEAETV